MLNRYAVQTLGGGKHICLIWQISVQYPSTVDSIYCIYYAVQIHYGCKISNGILLMNNAVCIDVVFRNLYNMQNVVS